MQVSKWSLTLSYNQTLPRELLISIFTMFIVSFKEAALQLEFSSD